MALLLLLVVGIFHQGYTGNINFGIKVPISGCAAAEAHNHLRRLHRSTEDLNGDEGLVFEATECALHILNTNETCETDVDVAQNIAVFPMQTQKPDIDSVVAGWYSPLNSIRLNDSISYINFTIEKVASAARIVWTTTTKVGCGAATSVGREAMTIYVCLYVPGANWNGFSDMDFVDYINLKIPRVEEPEKEFDGHCKDEKPDECKRFLGHQSKEYVKQKCTSIGFVEKSCRKSCGNCGTDKKD